MRWSGCFANHQNGVHTAARTLFPVCGGTMIMRRFVSPVASFATSREITSRCGLRTNSGSQNRASVAGSASASSAWTRWISASSASSRAVNAAAVTTLCRR